jgi:hypothetical protein
MNEWDEGSFYIRDGQVQGIVQRCDIIKKELANYRVVRYVATGFIGPDKEIVGADYAAIWRLGEGQELFLGECGSRPGETDPYIFIPGHRESVHFGSGRRIPGPTITLLYAHLESGESPIEFFIKNFIQISEEELKDHYNQLYE